MMDEAERRELDALCEAVGLHVTTTTYSTVVYVRLAVDDRPVRERGGFPLASVARVSHRLAESYPGRYVVRILRAQAVDDLHLGYFSALGPVVEAVREALAMLDAKERLGGPSAA